MTPETAFEALIFLGAFTVYAGGLVLLGLGVRMFADAAAAAHRARAHGIEADMQRESVLQARDVADEVIRRRAPQYGERAQTEDEIREAIIRQRMNPNGQTSEQREYTTAGDVSPDELNEHMQGGEYRV